MLKQINIGGQLRPIHFGLWALTQISEALNIDQTRLLEGIFVTKLTDQITITRIGLIEGAKKLARHYATPPDPIALALTDETVADWLDEQPEALDEATSVYFEQCFGKKLEAILREMENMPDLKTEADNLKNAWERVTNTASQLPSLDFRK